MKTSVVWKQASLFDAWERTVDVYVCKKHYTPFQFKICWGIDTPLCGYLHYCNNNNNNNNDNDNDDDDTTTTTNNNINNK